MTDSALLAGEYSELGPAAGLPALLVDVHWQAHVECDLSVLVLGPGRRVADDTGLVFFNQPILPDRSVVLLTQGGQEQRAQVALDLSELASSVGSILLSLSTVVPDGTLSSVRDLSVLAIDPSDGAVLARVVSIESLQDPCVVVAELVRSESGVWQLHGVDRSYEAGLAGLARAHGVSV